jgi:hypothetical protein
VYPTSEVLKGQSKSAVSCFIVNSVFSIGGLQTAAGTNVSYFRHIVYIFVYKAYRAQLKGLAQMKIFFVRFKVLTEASMKFRFVLWDVLPCKIIVDRRFRGVCCLHHHGAASIIALMMEAARTSKTSVDNYFTWQYIPEGKSELKISYLAWVQCTLFLKLPVRRFCTLKE